MRMYAIEIFNTYGSYVLWLFGLIIVGSIVLTVVDKIRK